MFPRSVQVVDLVMENSKNLPPIRDTNEPILLVFSQYRVSTVYLGAGLCRPLFIHGADLSTVLLWYV